VQRDALRVLVLVVCVSVKWRNAANYKEHLVMAATGVRWDYLQFQDRQHKAGQVPFRHDFNTLAFGVVTVLLALQGNFDSPGGMLFQLFPLRN